MIKGNSTITEGIIEPSVFWERQEKQGQVSFTCPCFYKSLCPYLGFLMMSYCVPLAISMDCLMLLAISFAAAFALVCCIMINAINTCILTAMMAAVMAAPMTMCHDRCR